MSDSDALHILVLFGTAKQWRSLFKRDEYVEREIWSQLYRAYIVSTAWRRKKNEAIERAKGICPCGAIAVQAHHLSYSRLGDEASEDLQAVCLDCHNRVHSMGQDARNLFDQIVGNLYWRQGGRKR